jgi:hypothetical protein
MSEKNSVLSLKKGFILSLTLYILIDVLHNVLIIYVDSNLIHLEIIIKVGPIWTFGDLFYGINAISEILRAYD